MNNNVFSLERFRVKHPEWWEEQAVEKKAGKAAPPKRPKTDVTFARIPYRRVTRLHGQLSAAAYAVMIELDHQPSKPEGRTL